MVAALEPALHPSAGPQPGCWRGLQHLPAADKTSEVSVTFRQTALSEAGDKYVREFAADFPSQREHLRHAISRRLEEIRGR